jgi:predicted membrane protein
LLHQKNVILNPEIMNTHMEKHPPTKRGWNCRDTVKNKRMKKFAFGILVLLAGFFLLGFNLEFIPIAWKPIVFSWQMLLIAIGVVSLFGKDSYIPGIILLLVGGIFIIPKFGILPFSVHSLFIPALLIAIGLIVLFKGFGPKKPNKHKKFTSSMSDDGYINIETIFGGTKQLISHQEFKGGKISCIFGGAEIDLTQANLAPGDQTLEISAIFGGATVIVPPDWKVEVKNSSFLGGFEDKRRVIREQIDPSRKLILQVEAIFGGGEIKSF